jgi:5,5'-dehydrodivanillate O-demethylase
MKRDENELLTRIGPGTPCGETLRRYWWPIATTADVTAKPKSVRVLGENLVMFRTASGTIGLLELACAHRGASLEYGRVEEEAIRCCYHGWKFDLEGRCVEQPFEPEGSTLKKRVRQKAYVARDAGGLVFAYMGPKPVPEFPKYDLLFQEDRKRAVWGRDVHNNWLQGVENPVDPYHVMSIHAAIYPELAFTRPHIVWEEKWYGIEMNSVGANGFTERYHHVFPGTVRVNVQRVGQESCQYMIWQTPRDDTSTVAWFVWASESREPPFGLTTAPYQATEPGKWRRVEDGWFGLWERDQDDAVISSQGLIADRTRENLGTSDKGVVLYRKMLKQAIQAVKAGKDPIGVIREPSDAIIEFSCYKTGLGAQPGEVRAAEKGKALGIVAPFETT